MLIVAYLKKQKMKMEQGEGGHKLQKLCLCLRELSSHRRSDETREQRGVIKLEKWGIVDYGWSLSNFRECVGTGAAGTQTRRSLGHPLLHPLNLRLLVLCAPTDFEAQSSLL